MNPIWNELVMLARAFGAAFTALTSMNILSLIVGAFAATLFELPIISRFKRH